MSNVRDSTRKYLRTGGNGDGQIADKNGVGFMNFWQYLDKHWVLTPFVLFGFYWLVHCAISIIDVRNLRKNQVEAIRAQVGKCKCKDESK